MRKFLILWVATGTTALLGGCSASEQATKADKRFTRGEYETAIPLYKADVKRGKRVAYSNYRIAESYRLSNRIEQGEEFYKAAVNGGVKSADARFYYGLALKANGKYDEAAEYFTAYAETGGNQALATRAELEAKNLKQIPELLALKTNNEVQALDSLNSPSADFSATLMPTTRELVFASGRDGKKYLGNGEGFNDLYAIKFADEQNMTGGTVRKLEAKFNAPGMHEASATYSPDGKMMIFARSNDGTKKEAKKGFQSVDLFVSYYRGAEWTEPELLRGVNSRTADDFSPVLSPDGKTLYFASSRTGGQGGNDLYKATLEEGNRFASPENLGDKINTPGNENFPAVAPDGTLYFSSDGYPGLGKLDIFMVDKGVVKNLAAPINSPGDDFAPFFTAKDMGVFSSNRSGGKGSDDLYLFRKKPRKLVTLYADGTVLERDSKTRQTKPLAGEDVVLLGRNGQRLQETKSGPDGKFTFKLDTATTYALVADRPGYFTARQGLSTIGKVPPQDQLPNEQNDIRLPVTLTLDKIVVNKAIVVENIFYDFNKWNIRPDAALELDKLVETLNDNPKITIELSSHTDSRGKDAYNLNLSQKRAQSAVDYIISKGIDKSRITARGYGETRPVIKNARKEEEHQRNRRTEFKVTRIDQ
ncbi:OmpA family protein [Hymenobacter sp. DG25A]|uniref:OmpA family protein n=1 Tax=Hymenobacter sp. DG25A TaxID=1385663 RepID=UPI0006BC5561|nr:OmpA family protein [Hymenobacter sp. DG25A]ALD22100.1 hypothetical protein AM218_13880 [Hymenobacter sp. DG25A]